MHFDEQYHGPDTFRDDDSLGSRPLLMVLDVIRGLQAHSEWVAGQIDRALGTMGIPGDSNHEAPCKSIMGRTAIPAHNVKRQAEDLIIRCKNDGPLPKKQREALEQVITKQRTNTPLDEHVILQLARLSYRQLRRLNKQQLISSDKRLIKAMQEVKSCNK